jgi:anthranilate phosphoribosyltransferase
MSAILEAVHKAASHKDLSSGEAFAAVEEILYGKAPESLVSALLVALRMKGETVDEIVGFARALRRHSVRVECAPDVRPLVDTCGTGGDGAGTFNISTAAAFVAAGAGARVAKHGNRSISSCCGSADVLEELGARIILSPAGMASCVREVGIGFLFAPALHPAMAHVQPVRAALKMRTVFNLLGPLANPAGAEVQIVGVFERRLVALLAKALAQMGLRRGLVVHGSDGLDEITVTGPTEAAEIVEGRVIERTLLPEEFGAQRRPAYQIAGGGRQRNAAIVRAVLSGEEGPHRDIVVANAAAALVMSGIAPDFPAGAAAARDSIDSGKAAETLDRFIRFTQAQSG